MILYDLCYDDVDMMKGRNYHNSGATVLMAKKAISSTMMTPKVICSFSV
jgi:hypothetical protein